MVSQLSCKGSQLSGLLNIPVDIYPDNFYAIVLVMKD